MQLKIHCWIILCLSSLLLLTLDAEGKNSDCSPTIKVRRHTVYKALVGEKLQINCPFTSCKNSSRTIFWFTVDVTNVPVNFSKSTHIKTQTNMSSDLEGTAYLIFENIQIKDSGLYQCRIEDNMGHKINVSVYGNDKPTIDLMENKTSTPLLHDVFPYLYSAAGILGFVTIVIIISFISMQVFHQNVRKSKKDTQTDKQYIEIPMVEQPSPAPTGSPAPLPSRRSSRKQRPPSQPSELLGNAVYAQIVRSEEARREAEAEEGSSLVYAALNHPLPPRAPARPRIQVEETSEYAAIRVS